MRGTTKSGFPFEVTMEALDNMELVDALADLEDSGGKDPIAMSRVAALLLGKSQKQRLYDHHRTQDGRVPLAAVYSAVTEIFLSMQQGKNC